MVCRAWRTTRAGVCQSCQRSVLGSALASGPRRHSSWNQRTRSAAKHTSAIHARLASRSVNGNRSRPEALSRRMWSSTCAWARRCTSASTAVAGPVGELAPEPVVQRREQAGLRARVQWLAAHDEPGAFGPAGQVDEVGELGDRGAVALLTGLGERRRPPVLIVDGAADRRFDLRVRAGHDRKADVAGPELAGQAGAAAGRVGSHLHRSTHRPRVVTGVVAGRDPRRELPDRGVEHRELIGDRVGRRVARPQQPGERLAGRVREAEHGREPEPALVVRGGAFLVLGMDVDQRRVEIQDHRRLPVVAEDRRHTCARVSAIASHTPSSAAASIDRRVRYNVESDAHRAEQRRLRAEPFDVRARLAAASEHQHRLDQHLAPIMEPEPRLGDPRRQRITQPSRSANEPNACNPT